MRSLTDSALIREELCHGHRITRKTIERFLFLLDLHFEEILQQLWTRLNGIYPGLSADVYVDGSHIPRNGKGRGAYTAAGEGGGTVQLQDKFMVAQLVESGLWVLVEVYRGNLNDPSQYADFIPQLMLMLKRGSTITMDNGDAVKSLLCEIKGMDHLTRVRMNGSDIERIRREIGDTEYVCDGTICISHRFESSYRHTFPFFSVDRYITGHLQAERETPRLQKMAQDTKDFTKEYDVAKVVRETEREDRGWFKPESSKRLTPLQALQTYRHRVGIEALISSIKSVVNLKPLRVWSGPSTRGSVLLGMITQLCVSMVRYDLEPETVERRIDGRVVRTGRKLSSVSICRSLAHWTVVLVPGNRFAVNRVYADENDLTRRISEVLDRYRRCFRRLSGVSDPWNGV